MCLQLGEYQHADAEARRLLRTRDLLGEGYLAFQFVAFLKIRKLSSVPFCYLRDEEEVLIHKQSRFSRNEKEGVATF